MVLLSTFTFYIQMHLLILGLKWLSIIEKL